MGSHAPMRSTGAGAAAAVLWFSSPIPPSRSGAELEADGLGGLGFCEAAADGVSTRPRSCSTRVARCRTDDCGESRALSTTAGAVCKNFANFLILDSAI